MEPYDSLRAFWFGVVVREREASEKLCCRGISKDNHKENAFSGPPKRVKECGALIRSANPFFGVVLEGGSDVSDDSWHGPLFFESAKGKRKDMTLVSPQKRAEGWSLKSVHLFVCACFHGGGGISKDDRKETAFLGQHIIVCGRS